METAALRVPDVLGGNTQAMKKLYTIVEITASIITRPIRLRRIFPHKLVPPDY